MELSQLSGLTATLGAVTLAAGTTTTVSTTAAIIYAIDGKAYTATALSNTAHPSTDVNTGAAFVPIPAGYGAIFIYGINSAKALKVAQGSLVALDASGQFPVAPPLPAMPLDFAPFGYLIYKAAAGGATFTLGSSNSAGVSGGTYTRGDLATYPSRPITA